MRKFLTWALALSLCVVGLSSCSRDNDNIGKDGINGKDGKNGKDGNTILSGQGKPSATLGKIGDFYLDEDTKNLYGPKSDKGWGNPASLKGKDGTNGTDGKNGSKILKGNTTPDSSLGNEGDWYIDTTNKKIYYKNASGWEEIFDIGNNAPTTLKGEYILSKDGTTLYSWLNKERSEINMQDDPELSKVTTIGANAFQGYQNLTKITFPDGLTKIGRSAFAGASLTSITIPNGVTSIEEGTFAGNMLTSVTFNNNIISIKENAFYNNRLTSITIPNSVESIGVNAFGYNQLTTITIPTNVKSISTVAFANNMLTSVNVEAPTPPNAITEYGRWAAFDNDYSNTPIIIYVPKGKKETYQKATGWSEYTDKIQEKK